MSTKQDELTPMMRQFFSLKAKHPDALLLFRWVTDPDARRSVFCVVDRHDKPAITIRLRRLPDSARCIAIFEIGSVRFFRAGAVIAVKHHDAELKPLLLLPFVKLLAGFDYRHIRMRPPAIFTAFYCYRLNLLHASPVLGCCWACQPGTSESRRARCSVTFALSQSSVSAFSIAW